MKCTSDLKWKYLRETKLKYFDCRRNTPLSDYLEAIFPEYKFEYNYRMKKLELPTEYVYHQYVCDAICKEQKLVVEFDGLNHYMDSQVVLNDSYRDLWFRTLGYQVVRIPYWIQLSNLVIHDLFHVEVDQEMCKLDYCFYTPETDSVNLNATPGNMCELGRTRFVNEFNLFCLPIRTQIFNDLLTCSEHVDNSLVETIVPLYILNRLRLADVLTLFDLARIDTFTNLYRLSSVVNL